MALLPTRLRQFPTFVRQVWERERILRRPVTKTTHFHLCYFSCAAHFRFLYCSLHSVKSALGTISHDVRVFADQDDPFDDAQVACLRSLMPNVRIVSWPYGRQRGTEYITSIWNAYGSIATESIDDDFIVCVDSDVFFINDRIFRAASRTDADLIGDGHYVDFRYVQGGCYFLKVRAVRQIMELLARKSVSEFASEGIRMHEDLMASHFVRSAGLRSWLTWYMMFPDELRFAKRMDSWQRWKFSCLHFVGKDKASMLQAYEKHVLAGELPEDFRQVMATDGRPEVVVGAES